MNCNLQHTDDKLTCPDCGFSMKFRPGRVLRNCPVLSEKDPSFSYKKLDIPELPTLWEQAKHLTGDLVSWGVAGFTVPEKQERERRLEICQGCEKFTGQRCSECGCQCSWASWLETKTCPHPDGDKWKKEQNAQP